MKYKAEQCNNMQIQETDRKQRVMYISFHLIYFDYACQIVRKCHIFNSINVYTKQSKSSVSYVIRFHRWPLRCLVVGHVCLSLELEDSNVGGQNVLIYIYIYIYIFFFFWGGGGTWPSETQGENLQKIFEIFILEITANASNFNS